MKSKVKVSLINVHHPYQAQLKIIHVRVNSNVRISLIDEIFQRMTKENFIFEMILSLIFFYDSDFAIAIDHVYISQEV